MSWKKDTNTWSDNSWVKLQTSSFPTFPTTRMCLFTSWCWACGVIFVHLTILQLILCCQSVNMTKNFKGNLVPYYHEWVPPLNIVGSYIGILVLILHCYRHEYWQTLSPRSLNRFFTKDGKIELNRGFWTRLGGQNHPLFTGCFNRLTC